MTAELAPERAVVPIIAKTRRPLGDLRARLRNVLNGLAAQESPDACRRRPDLLLQEAGPGRAHARFLVGDLAVSRPRVVHLPGGHDEKTPRRVAGGLGRLHGLAQPRVELAGKDRGVAS